MSTDSLDLPVNYGIVLFPTFQAGDAFGPLDVLNAVSLHHYSTLSIIAETMDPVSVALRPGALAEFFGNRFPNHNSPFEQTVNPTHTLENAPPLDVLIIPGGVGVLDGDMSKIVQFVRERYPSLKYLLTICTGAWVAAEAGVLDGKKATANKALWSQMTTQYKNVNWVAHARWMHDGNVWSTSGASAGIDGTYAFIEAVYGKEVATSIANDLEYIRHTDPSDDPFAKLHKLV